MLTMTVKVSIAWRCMNEGDVYILDVGEVLYVWNGKSSSRTERIKVCELLKALPSICHFLVSLNLSK